jgi:sec-independent protein translocase protein TatC
MSLFISLTILMGVVFQLPVIALSLAKMGLVDNKIMAKYRRHALILIVVIAAIITPPDVLTLIIVSLPLYILYEVSILGVRVICRKHAN